MEAGGLGRRLLLEVERSGECLSSLLGDIQLTAQHHNATHGPLRVPAIDALLRPHLPDHLFNNSLGQNHHHHRNQVPAGSFDISSAEESHLPRDKPVIIEISSETPCAGKTQLVYYIACIALLPLSWNGMNLEGKAGAVVFIDCDGRFDILRLSQIMESYVQSRLSLAIQFCQSKHSSLSSAKQEGEVPLSSPPRGEEFEEQILEYLTLLSSVTTQDIAELVTHSLSHLHIYTPTSPSQFLETLAQIPSHLLSPSNHSQDRHLSSLIIDNISAFYWLERASAAPPSMNFSDPPSSSSQSKQTETEKIIKEKEEEEDKISLISRYELITSRLLKISTRFSSPVIITNSHVSPSSNFTNTVLPSSKNNNNNNKPEYPRHLPGCYTYSPNFLSARIILSKDLVAPFHVGIGIKEAFEEKEMRMEVVRKAGVSAWVSG